MVDFARDDFEQSALHLDALGFAGHLNANVDLDALGQVDALQIHVQQVVAHRIALPVHDHGGRFFHALDGQR